MAARHGRHPSRGRCFRPEAMTDSGKSHRYTAAWLFLLATLVVFPTAVRSADAPFTGASNWGGTGLMAVPTARVLKEGTYRLGAAQVHPYRYYYGAVSPLPGVEIDGRVTEIIGVQAFAGQGSDYGNFKDKAVDLKLQLIREMSIPRGGVGFMDPMGRASTAPIPCVSKRVTLRLHPGFRQRRCGKRELTDVGTGDSFKAEILTSPRLWWGRELVRRGPVLPWTALLMVEYDPTPSHTFQNDPARGYFPSPSVEVQLRPPPEAWDWMECPELPARRHGGSQPEPHLRTRTAADPYRRRRLPGNHPDACKPPGGADHGALYSSGFSDLSVLAQGGDLRIRRPIGVLLRHDGPGSDPRIVDRTARGDKGRPGDAPRLAFDDHLLHEPRGHSALRLEGTEPPGVPVRLGAAGRREEPTPAGSGQGDFDYGLKPISRTYLNDPSGFLNTASG